MTYSIIPVTRFAQNCSLLVCDETRQAAVIDPGGDIDQILMGVQKAGATVEKILITHGHLDHAAAAGNLAARTGARIEGPHEGDRFLLQALPQATREYGFPLTEAFLPERWLQQGDVVRFGNQILEVLHCPGHTPGHVAYFHRESQRVAVGDILFRGSIGATNQEYGNRQQLIASIRDRLFPLGDDVRFIPGHGRTSTIGWEREINPFVADYLFC